MPKKRVAVIGAGISGLAALRHLASDPDNFSPVVYDKSQHIGGLWVYTEETGTDASGDRVHSAIYKELRTNLAAEIMGYHDVPFPAELPSFMHHSDVLAYIRAFVEKFNLSTYIKLETKVMKVDPEMVQGTTVWHVTTLDLRTKVQSLEDFDAVFVCNGHEHCPRNPDISGLERFQGEILQSKYFRTSDPYKGKTVLVYGIGLGGLDIVLILAAVCKKIIAVQKDPLASGFPQNVFDARGIRECRENGVVLLNNEFHEVDVIILAIGYHYDFPFLSEGCHVKVKDDRITPLYKHVVHIEFPSLFFIGLVRRCMHFRIYNVQAIYACMILKGSIPLPSTADMLRDEAETYKHRIVSQGKPDRLTHDFEFGRDQYPYADDLGERIGIHICSPAVRDLLDAHLCLFACYEDFTKLNFRIRDDELSTKSK